GADDLWGRVLARGRIRGALDPPRDRHVDPSQRRQNPRTWWLSDGPADAPRPGRGGAAAADRLPRSLRPPGHRSSGHPDHDGAALPARLRPVRLADRVRRVLDPVRAVAVADRLPLELP